jgi:hypothetical protein
MRLRDVKLAALRQTGRRHRIHSVVGFAWTLAVKCDKTIWRCSELRKMRRVENTVWGLVLDMRRQSWWSLDVVIDVVPLGAKAVILCRPGQAFQGFCTAVTPIRYWTENQVAVLVSPTTSAAEIVSGAVQDLDAGIVVVLDLRQGIGAEC